MADNNGEIRLAQESILDLANALRGTTGNSAAPLSSPTGSSQEGASGKDLSVITSLLKSTADKIGEVAGWMAKQAGRDPEKLAGLKEAASGIIALKDSSYGASRAIDSLAGKIPVIGNLLTQAGLSLTGLLKTAEAGNKQGVGQGDPFALEAQARAAGFNSAKDLLDFLGKNYSNNMRVIGKSAQDSLERYGDFAQKTLESDLGKRLLGTGKYNAQELAQIAGIAAAGKTDMLRTEEGRKDLAEKTAKLASQIDAQSQITGENRDAIIQNMLATQNSTKAQLEMQALGNDQERQNYLKNQQLFDGMGKDMQNVVGTIQAGGRLSKEQRATLQVATGGRGGQFIQLLREQQRTAGLAEGDPAKIAANKALSDFVAGMNEYQKSQLFAQQAITTGNDKIRQAAFNAAEQNKLAGGQVAISKDTGRAAPEARDLQTNIGLQNQRGYDQRGILEGPGRQTPVYGSEMFKELAVQNEQVRKNATAAFEALSKFNSALGKTGEVVDFLRTAGEKTIGKQQTQAGTNKTVKEALDEVVNGIVKPVGRVEGTNSLGNLSPENVNITNPSRVVIQAPGTESKPTETKPAGGESKPTEAKPNTPVVGTRGTGTLGETGQATEPKDAIVKVHKGESVLTQDQREGMIKDSANSAIDKLLGKSNPRDPENQEVRYTKVDPNDPAIVKMREERKAEEAERAKYTRTREVADPFYKGGKRWETYDIRDEEAKQKEAAAAKVTPPEVQKQLTVDVPKVVPPTKNDVAVTTPKVEVPKIELPKGPSTESTTTQTNQPNDMFASVREFAKQRKQGKESGGASEINKAVMGMLTEIQSKLGITTGVKIDAKGKQSDVANMSQQFKDYQPKIPTVPPIPQIPDKMADNKAIPKETVTLKDLNDQLIQLNSNIKQLVSHGSATAQYAEQQVKATKGLSGNRFA